MDLQAEAAKYSYYSHAAYKPSSCAGTERKVVMSVDDET